MKEIKKADLINLLKSLSINCIAKLIGKDDDYNNQFKSAGFSSNFETDYFLYIVGDVVIGKNDWYDMGLVNRMLDKPYNTIKKGLKENGLEIAKNQTIANILSDTKYNVVTRVPVLNFRVIN